MPTIVHLVSLAGGRIICARCTAMSKRTKEQCGRAALKTSTTQKCQFHGGRGSGPKTVEGRQRIAQAHTVHGRETRQIRQERSQSALRLAQLEDMMHVLGMTTATRSRGRKPSAYWVITVCTNFQHRSETLYGCVCQREPNAPVHRAYAHSDGR